MCLRFLSSHDPGYLLLALEILGTLWMIGKCVCLMTGAQACFLDVFHR